MQLPSWLSELARKPDLGQIRLWLRGALTRNFGFKILSIIFAFAGWAWVQGEQVVEQKARVRLHWSIPEDLALVDNLPETLSLTASGSQVFVRNLRQADLELTVDLSDATPGVQSVEFEDRFIENLPQNINVVGLSPTRVEFVLDEKVTKQVNLEASLSGEPKAGLRLVGMELEPSTVLLEGPASVLVGISEVPTAAIDIGRFDRTGHDEVATGRLPQWARRVDDVPIVVSVRLEPITTSRTFPEVAVVVRPRSWISDVEFLSLSVSGPVDVVDELPAGAPTIIVTVSPDAELEPLVASREDGPATFEIVLSNLDELTINEMEPSTIEVHPVP